MNRQRQPVTGHGDRQEIDALLEAGRLLLQSGAEIYRVEETLSHMAEALHLEHFEAYVVNRGIFASGRDTQRQWQSRTVVAPTTVIRLDRIEEINRLSRRICSGLEPATPEHVLARLDEIRQMRGYRIRWIALAYFLGACGFSWSMSSTATDAVAAGLVGLVLSLSDLLAARLLHARFLRTLAGAFLAALSVIFLSQIGPGGNRSDMLLGALMVLVPGEIFVNSVREFSQNNHSAGMTLFMTALLTCAAMSAGVAAAAYLFPTGRSTASALPTDPSTIFMAGIYAGVGTLAFSVMFNVPRRYFADIGLLGTATWIIYLIMMRGAHWVLGVFFPTLLVAFLSRVLAAARECPATIFLYTSIFPLLPGLSLYRAVYALLTGAPSIDPVRSCFVSAFAIAIAVAIVQQIPGKFFLCFAHGGQYGH